MSLLSITELLHAFSRNNKTIGQHPVVCFVGEQYPLLFFSWLLPRMSPEDQQFISLELGQHSHAEIRAQLETSFLGQQSVYWVRNIGDESARELRSWIGYLQEYTGPNSVLFFVPETALPSKHTMHTITVPAAVDGQLLELLLKTIATMSEHNAHTFAKKVLARYRTISLDQAYLIAHYVQLSGCSMDDFIHEWLDKILVADASLFALSTAFFAKNTQDFFVLWAQLEQLYSPQFWVSYWAEQLWRAYWFVRFMQVGDNLEAKKISYRLPFSFMQKDWRRYDPEQLKHMHAQIYTVDFQLKNSGGAFAFDTIYGSFFESLGARDKK
jgi:hypothetical protein